MPKYHFDIVHEDAVGITCGDHIEARRKADAIADKIARSAPDTEPRAILLFDEGRVAVYKVPIPAADD